MAYVVLYGPRDFPAHREMDMRKAFAQIREGLLVCGHQARSPVVLDQIKQLVDHSEAIFASGDDVTWAHPLQDAMMLITDR